MRAGKFMALALTAAVVAACTTTSGFRAEESGGEVSMNDASTLREGMRKLWADHVVWTRNYIVAAVADDPGAPSVAARLLRNQEDIGSAIAPYYGAAAGTKLTALLKDHINIAVDLVAAAKANDNAKLTAADKRWHDNAAEIATFLSGANPNWPRATLLTMLNEHLRLTTQEATARIQKRWTDDVSTFDRIFEQSMHMADALSAGIVKQFPTRFD
jgi:hypothetical protein